MNLDVVFTVIDYGTEKNFVEVNKLEALLTK